MDETRFTRLENRVDEIKDDLAEVKAEQKVNAMSLHDLKEDIREQTKAVLGHVAGDEKIITEIAPIIEEFRFQQEKKKRRNESLKTWGLRLGIPATIIGMLAGAAKFWFSFF